MDPRTQTLEQLQQTLDQLGQVIRRRLHASPLRPRSAHILSLLARADTPEQMTPSRISQQLCVKPPTLTPMLQRMEQEGLLCRRHSQRDRRLVYLVPTALGLTRLEEHRRLCQQVYTGLFSALDDGQLQQLCALYEKVLAAQGEEETT